jgi:chemotaxis protein MotB
MLVNRSSAADRLPRQNGEGYLASSADLMIGILFIFIIMVVYLAVEIKRVQVDGTRSADPVRTLVDELGRRLKSRGIGVELDPDSGVISLPADALFNKGAHIPRENALETINKTNEVLSQVIPCYVRATKKTTSECTELNKRGVELETVMVEGHTDADQYANDPDKNWHLGLDRARFVFNELGRGELGLLRNGKGQPILGVSSYADTRPAKLSTASLSTDETADVKEKDRRVELRFILSYQGDDGVGSAKEITRAVESR